MSWSLRALFVSILIALAITACGGGAEEGTTSTTTAAVGETSETEVETTTSAPTTTTPTTTTNATTTEEPTTTPAPTTTAVAVADDAAVIEYCMAHDDLDAFFDADFPAEDELQAAIDEQQILIAAMVPPTESLETAHETYVGAILEFYDEFESNGLDISDERFEEIFTGLDLTFAERIIERYREVNCEGFEGDSESEIVSGQLSFEVGQCLDQTPSGDFDDLACDEPHDYQVYSTIDVEDADTYPGEAELAAEAEVVCLDAFEPFVGASFSTSIYYVTTLRPTSGSWLVGDREIVCLIQAETGKLSKDVKGAGE